MRRHPAFRLLLLAGLLLATWSGAARPPVHQLVWKIELASVERQAPGRPAETLEPTAPNTFDDDVLRIVWSPDRIDLKYELTNRSEGTMRLLLDETAYVGPSGNTETLLSESHDAGSSGPAPVVTIIRGAKYKGWFKPASTVRWQETPSRGWFYDTLIATPQPSRNVADLESHLPKEPLTMKLLLPVDASGAVTEYTFVFHVTGSVVPR